MGCFPFFWTLHIPSQRPPNAPRSPVISMKYTVLPQSCVAKSQVFGSDRHLVDGVDLATGLTGHPRISEDKFTLKH